MAILSFLHVIHCEAFSSPNALNASINPPPNQKVFYPALSTRFSVWILMSNKMRQSAKYAVKVLLQKGAAPRNYSTSWKVMDCKMKTVLNMWTSPHTPKKPLNKPAVIRTTTIAESMLLLIKCEVYLCSSFAAGSVKFGRSVTKPAALESVRAQL